MNKLQQHIYGFDDNRCSGRSTALAFKYISEAMQHPGRRVQIIDHYPRESADKFLQQQIATIINKLDYKFFELDSAGGKHTLTFNIY